MSLRRQQLEAHESVSSATVQTNAGEWRTLGESRWEWTKVRRILVVRLRSIGDTVLMTPALHALRRFLPHAEIDVLLEDWVAPVLNGSDSCDRVITTKRDGTFIKRVRLARELRAARYDVAFNLHGGTTATLLVRASGATHRVGFANYQMGRLHNHAAPPSNLIWGREKVHSVEQQLALIGWTGVPVNVSAHTRLAVTEEAIRSLEAKLRNRAGGAGKSDLPKPFAVIHPAAAFASKLWATENFARIVEHLAERGIASVALAAPDEKEILNSLENETRTPVLSFTDLTLPEITALLARAGLFVGNDSGIAHMAAAVGAPTVVVFGSSNITHWRPWTPSGGVPSEFVREEMPCAPCPGCTCREFAQPECIRRVSVERVTAAIDRTLSKAINHES